ncbi:large exoprotein [Microbacterium sp. NPDC090007]|uniref:large exoprotein n=1 Tax=Microbacterium sp. NPDC090007 TaxID=3364204 RepID=UPI00382D4E3C
MDINYLAYSDYGAPSAGEAALLAITYLFLFLLAIAGYVISSFLLMRIFDKAGVQGKWRAWVPLYNYLVFAKLGDVSPWIVLGLAVASAIPILNVLAGLGLVVALVMISYRVNAKFGREWPLLLLFLLGPLGQWIFLAILAFGRNPWNPAIRPAPWANSFLADKTVWNGIPVQPGQQVAGGTNGPGYGGSGYPGSAYGTPPAPPAQGYTPPQTPPASGTTPPPPAPPASGTTPPPPAPPAGPRV